MMSHAERNTWLSFAEIDRDALRANAAWFRKRLGGRRLYAVVKADAYGHGIETAVPAFLEGGADALAVAHAEEGAAVRRYAPADVPILVFSPAHPGQAALYRRHRLTATVCDLEGMERFAGAAADGRDPIPVEVNVDTGMGRLGSRHEEAAELIRAVARHPALELVGVYSHLACADEDAAFTAEQIRRFESIRNEFRDAVPLWHLANSAGVILHSESALFDGARGGIALYGAVPGPGCPLPQGIRPALAWRAKITFVKHAAAGRTVSYGATFTTSRPTILATVAAGYADGYPRSASGRAEAIVRGRRCPVVGRVTMDQIVLDVSGREDAAPGETVTLLGRDGGEEITAGEIAGWAGTISYEILTGISRRVPRRAVAGEEGSS